MFLYKNKMYDHVLYFFMFNTGFKCKLTIFYPLIYKHQEFHTHLELSHKHHLDLYSYYIELYTYK